MPGALALMALLALLLSACGSGTSTASGGGKVNVVAAENFWGDIAAQIGGSEVKVTSIISDPSADPHLYASNAANAAAVAQAQVVIENGVGYDAFMNDLLERLRRPSGGRLGAGGAQGERRRCQPPSLVRHPAGARRRRRHRAGAGAGRSRPTRPPSKPTSPSSIARWPLLKAVIAQIRGKYGGAPVAYTERVPGYLLADAGLTVASPPGFAAAIENGNEPAPADVQAMNALLSGHKVRLLLYNEQAVSAVTQRVRSAGAAERHPRGRRERDPAALRRELPGVAAAPGAGDPARAGRLAS